jgi:hypothetical protein
MWVLAHRNSIGKSRPPHKGVIKIGTGWRPQPRRPRSLFLLDVPQ